MAPGKLVLGPEETRTTAAPTIRHFPRSQQFVLGQIGAASKNKHNSHPMIHPKPPQRFSRTFRKEKAWLFFKCLVHLLASATHSLATINECLQAPMCPFHVMLSRSPEKAKKVSTYKDIQAAVSFKAELDMLQSISFQFEPDTPPTVPLNVKNLCLQLKRGLGVLKLSFCTSQPCSNFPHLSTIFYFTSACILLAHRYIQLSTISSSDHLVPQLPWAVYQEQSLSFPAQVSLTAMKERSGKSHVQRAKINHSLSACAPRMKKSRGKGLSQCPPGRQAGTVPLGAQAQNPQHCQHPLAEHFYGAASIQASIKTTGTSMCYQLWRALFSTPTIWDTHGKFYTVSKQNLWNFCPLPQTKSYNNNKDSFREDSLKGSPRNHV